MTDIPVVDLGRGVTMPIVGFGTRQLGGRRGYEAIRSALDVGYRHIDTATMYRNESEVGQPSGTATWTAAACSSPPSGRPATPGAPGPPCPTA